MRIIAAIDDPPVLEKILSHLGLPIDRPALAPARSPPETDEFGDFDLGELDALPELDDPEFSDGVTSFN